MNLKEIGVIKTPYKSLGEAPEQGISEGGFGEIVVFDEYAEGLQDLDEYTHLIVLYWLNEADRSTLKAVPPQEEREYGVFATRSPHRPNPIGFCVVEILEVNENKISVKGLDAVDNSVLLDLKPTFLKAKR